MSFSKILITLFICFLSINVALGQNKAGEISQIDKCQFLRIALNVDSAVDWLCLRAIKSDTINIFDWTNSFDGCGSINTRGMSYRVLAMTPTKPYVVQAAITQNGVSYEVVIVSSISGRTAHYNFVISSKQVKLVSCRLGDT